MSPKAIACFDRGEFEIDALDSQLLDCWDFLVLALLFRRVARSQKRREVPQVELTLRGSKSFARKSVVDFGHAYGGSIAVLDFASQPDY